MTEYRITRLADYDLEGIWDYTVQEWSLDQAEKYVRGLFACFEAIAYRRIKGKSVGQWQNEQLKPLTSGWERTFTTTGRDSLSRIPHRWSLSTPKSASANPLTIRFAEPLDHELLLETFFIDDPKGNLIRGTWQPGPGDRSIMFILSGTWKPDNYTIRVSTELDDPAGNNLNRPFEKNVAVKRAVIENDFVEISFSIR